MGLLDDAIREHLELKRLRGADPSEVARDERAALGPPEEEDGDGYDLVDHDVVESAEESDGYEEELAAEGAERSAEADLSHSSEETMEVDMRTIIDADDQGYDDAEVELNGDAMAANAAAYGGGDGQASSSCGVAPDSAASEPRERRWWPAARPMRALGLGRDPSVEGSLP